jgi:hypothetical protein
VATLMLASLRDRLRRRHKHDWRPEGSRDYDVRGVPQIACWRCSTCLAYAETPVSGTDRGWYARSPDP